VEVAPAQPREPGLFLLLARASRNKRGERGNGRGFFPSFLLSFFLSFFLFFYLMGKSPFPCSPSRLGGWAALPSPGRVAAPRIPLPHPSLIPHLPAFLFVFFSSSSSFIYLPWIASNGKPPARRQAEGPSLTLGISVPSRFISGFGFYLYLGNDAASFYRSPVSCEMQRTLLGKGKKREKKKKSLLVPPLGKFAIPELKRFPCKKIPLPEAPASLPHPRLGTAASPTR